jgi:hypothetical protein
LLGRRCRSPSRRRHGKAPRALVRRRWPHSFHSSFLPSVLLLLLDARGLPGREAVTFEPASVCTSGKTHTRRPQFIPQPPRPFIHTHHTTHNTQYTIHNNTTYNTQHTLHTTHLEANAREGPTHDQTGTAGHGMTGHDRA